jgi:Uncharacterised nucleotidyltransferase
MPNNNTQLSISTEIQTLINLGKLSFSKENTTDFEAFQDKNPVNWDKIYTLARFHQIRPIILRGAIHIHNKGVPESFLLKLKEDCLHLTFHGLHQTTELLRLLKIYKNNNILAIPYKGVWLANTYYGGWGMREFSDIDLFVFEHDMPNFKKIMLKQGYVPQMNLTPEQETMMMKILCELNFDIFDKDNNRLFHIEPHFKSNGISDGVKHLTLHDLQPRLVEMPFANTTISSFSAEDNLLLTVIHHGLKEGWALLKYLFDVYAILKKEHKTMDWAYVLTQAEQLKISNPLFIGLNLMHYLFEIPFSDALMQHLNKPKIKELAHTRCLNLDDMTVKNRLFSLFIFNLKGLDSWSDRLKIIINRLFYPHLEDIIYVSLPPRLFFLYFFLRPFRGLLKFLKPNASSNITRNVATDGGKKEG